jgi:hypothetical protein
MRPERRQRSRRISCSPGGRGAPHDLAVIVDADGIHDLADLEPRPAARGDRVRDNVAIDRERDHARGRCCLARGDEASPRERRKEAIIRAGSQPYDETAATAEPLLQDCQEARRRSVWTLDQNLVEPVERYVRSDHHRPPITVDAGRHGAAHNASQVGDPVLVLEGRALGGVHRGWTPINRNGTGQISDGVFEVEGRDPSEMPKLLLELLESVAQSRQSCDRHKQWTMPRETSGRIEGPCRVAPEQAGRVAVVSLA